ncbi:hypothetical protein [Fictibacillus phosphorivorans]|uniref:hypothetical protein n=1 Tax=Fictibacillus phosphorivorans TaxID=1221500 RepID=UPI00203A9E97|nr:hypothetical protein [Fictibacillus phosphorivorans]MCM3718193.1 hypothetical protein [Fictibacillus phosphorivorans]MCM3775940.1 hypothetical protein [Fictibacillus phosphorivorans]
MRTTDEKIKLRNHWFKIILISLFSMVFMFKIAVTTFTFHFSDLLAFLLAIFAIGICSMFYVKINEALQAFSAAGKSFLPGSPKDTQNETEEAEEILETEITYDESEKEEMERQLFMLEDQVKRMKQVQQEITNRLVDEDLHEDDKRDYIDYLLQKEKEIMLAKQEIVRITSLLDPEEMVEDEYENDEQQVEEIQDEQSIQTATAKDVVQLLGKEFVLNASLEQFNHKMREIQHSITVETANHLKEEGLIDPYFNVTRKGLKEFRRAAKKFSYGDSVKFLSKVVQRGNHR